MTRLQPLWGRLTADLAAGGGTVEVDDPSLLTGTSQFAIVAPNSQRVEIMTVTGGAGTHGSPWSVTRGVRGTTATEHWHGAKVQGLNFTLTVGLVDYTFRANDLVISGASPGGDDQLTFSRFMPDPVVLPSLGDPVVLASQENPGLWLGITEEPAPHYYPKGGALLSFTAHGYSQNLSDGVYTQSKVLNPATLIPPGLTTARIIKTALGDLCTLISSDYSKITAGGQGIQQATGDLLGKNTLNLVTEYTPIGDAYIPSIWHVRGFGTASPTFELRRKDLAIRYQINLEDTLDGVVVKTTRSDVYTTVLVRWHDGVAEYTDPIAHHDIGNVKRALLVDASSLIGDSDTAYSYAKTLGQVLAKVRPKAGEIKILATKPIYDVFLGHNVDPWEVYEGNYLQIMKGGVPLDSGNIKIPYTDGFFLRSRRFDFKAGMLTLATSDELAEIGKMISKVAVTELTRHDSGTKMVTGPMWSNPNSPNLPVPSALAPSMRFSKDQQGRLGYEDLAEGADTGAIALSWGGTGSDEPAAVEVGVQCGLQIFTPTIIHSLNCRVLPIDPANTNPQVTIAVEVIHMTVNPLDGTQTLVAGGIIDTIVMNSTTAQLEPGTTGGWVLKKRHQFVPGIEVKTDDTIIGLIVANDAATGVRYASVTLRPQKTSGQSVKPTDTAGVGVVSNQSSRGGTPTPACPTVGATFKIATSNYVQVQITYYLHATGSFLGMSSLSPKGKIHVLAIPPIPVEAIAYDIIMFGDGGVKTTVAGLIMF